MVVKKTRGKSGMRKRLEFKVACKSFADFLNRFPIRPTKHPSISFSGTAERFQVLDESVPSNTGGDS